MRYRDFELLIGEKHANGYHVRVKSPGGEADGILAIDPDALPVRENLARLERHDTDEAFLKSFGESLFEELFTGGIRDAFHYSLAEVRAEEIGLRIRLCIEPPAISALPWEYLYDPEGRFFLSTSPEILISRYIQVAQPYVPLLIDLPMRILLVISSPSDLRQLDVEEEEARIRCALEPLIQGQQVELDVLRVATRQGIQSQLQAREYHVFHFIGHGDFRQDRGYLALVDKDSGQRHLMDAEDFSTFFLGQPMRLVILNACKTAETGTEKAFVGMAPHLVRRRIPAVIAMRYSIPDRTAVLFSGEFYRPLAKGYPVDKAVSEARKAILLDVGRGERDFGIPVLFMRAEDGVIVEFHSQKQDRIIAGTRDALVILKGLFEEHDLDAGLVALVELEDNLAELVKLNGHLLEWIELYNLLGELDRGLIPVYDEVTRKQFFDIGIPFVESQWRLWKDNVWIRLVTFARGITYVGEAYDEGEGMQGPNWMMDLVAVQGAVDEALEDMALRPLREHVEGLRSAISQHRHMVNRGMKKTATTLATLSRDLLRMMQR